VEDLGIEKGFWMRLTILYEGTNEILEAHHNPYR
jgi:hypothetical protein